ncbi:PREDICTED: protein MEI2-like 4 isoform X2 [Nicotiana attenuata]|uniref:Protein mei2-like 4 n=1 Tax=Nicotiana attenuata TaxID=49451 RepID=A0A314L6A9_NICAT|nr:PREDICTED: protein MEI2-like 4 isoform X2 [Nicotiana attenuata]OIT37321.1 protein mei2-like 4 [Nicotiana attenuata]
MPSQMREPQGLSPSSYFSEDLCFHDERQVGFWKTNSLQNYHGLKGDDALQRAAVRSSPLENHISLGSPMAKHFEHHGSYLKQEKKVNSIIEKQAFGVERASHSLPRALDHNLGVRSILSADLTSIPAEGDRISIMGGQYENGLFSSSLSELFSRKLRLPTNNSPHGHSVGAADSHYEEEEPFESLKELEAHAIGNLLPDDDDLLAGVTDGLDYVGRSNAGDDIEDLDLFSSVGGMDLGEDGSSPGQRNSEFAGNYTLQGGSSAAIGGKHPPGENPSRTLFIRNINSSVEDSELQTLFEQYGDIHMLYTACKHRGFVMISYYDIRASQHAMKALQNKPLRRRKLDIHFSIPKDNPSEKDVNQGTLLVFDLDSSVSNDELRQIFGVYGEIKEIRETPHRSHRKFVEFYDIRAAEAALRALNRSDIAGKQIKVEASHPGGTRRLLQHFPSELEQDEPGLYLQRNSPSILATGFSGALPHGGHTSSIENGSILGRQSASGSAINSYLDNAFDCGLSFSVPNSLLRLESKGNQANVGETGHLQSRINFEFSGTSGLHPHSLPEYHDGLSNGASSISPGSISATMNINRPVESENRNFSRVGSNGHSVELNEVFTTNGNVNCPSPGHQYIWSKSHQPQPQGMMWPNSPTFVGGVCATRPQQLHSVPRAPSHMLNALGPINNHHVGSAPSVNPSLSLWDRRHAYAGESPDASGFHPGSLGSMRISGNSPHHLEFIPHNVFPRTGGSCIDLSMSSSNVGLHSHHQRSLMFPGRGQIIPMINSFDSPNERMRSRRNEGSSNQTDNKKQFELDVDRIARGEDKRTTLMIKNIPNKYTSKMLLSAIDERHRGMYDFIYLPIDFKNKCNVGYAFINMTDPSLIVPFYHAFNGKKWEKFNSEKVASLAYARIQGKAALIAHFQNSSLMNEDKRCRPILFHTDGPNAGDQVPFPMGVNIRPRTSKNRAGTSEESYQESQTSLSISKDFVNEESSSGSVKESN